jgi:hypothetical protein
MPNDAALSRSAKAQRAFLAKSAQQRNHPGERITPRVIRKRALRIHRATELTALRSIPYSENLLAVAVDSVSGLSAREALANQENMVVAAGCTAALALFVPRWNFRVRALIYLLFLAILLPVSWYNYRQNDNVLPAHFQVGLNLLIVFLASTLVISLAGVEARAPDTRVLKTMALGLVLFGGVLVSGLFTLMWAIWASGMIRSAPSLEWSQLTSIGGLASAIVAWLSHRREVRKDTISSQPPPRIISSTRS